MLRLHSLRLLLPLAFFAPVGLSHSAEITDVIDADDGDDPWDFVGEVTWQRSLRRGKITREYNCARGDGTCPGAGPSGQLINVKELRYERITHVMVPRARFGLWHDLELSVEAPIVLQDTQSLRFAGDGGDPNAERVDPTNSSIAPGPVPGPMGEDPENLFNVPDTGLPTRAGFGDMRFMVRWSPISQERDDQRGDWTVELGYQAPTGQVMEFGNEGVGRGVHELIVATSLSRRFKYMDPFARIEAVFPFASKNSLFKDYGDEQEHTGPGNRFSFDMGTEVVPFEDTEKGVKFFLTMALGATYQGKGRDYSELFDALAIGGRGGACNPQGPLGAVNCAYYNPDSRSEIAGSPHDGITTVDEFMIFRGRLGAGAYIAHHVRLGLNVGLDHETGHLLTAANIGRDLDNSGLVEARNTTTGTYDAREHNPTYVPNLDAVGRRLRVEETTVFHVNANVAVLF